MTFDSEPRSDDALPQRGFYNVESNQESGMMLDMLYLFYLKNQKPYNW